MKPLLLYSSLPIACLPAGVLAAGEKGAPDAETGGGRVKYEKNPILGGKLGACLAPFDCEFRSRTLGLSLVKGLVEMHRGEGVGKGSEFIVWLPVAGGRSAPESPQAGFDHHLTKPVDPTALETFLGTLHLRGQA